MKNEIFNIFLYHEYLVNFENRCLLRKFEIPAHWSNTLVRRGNFLFFNTTNYFTPKFVNISKLLKKCLKIVNYTFFVYKECNCLVIEFINFFAFPKYDFLSTAFEWRWWRTDEVNVVKCAVIGITAFWVIWIRYVQLNVN